MTRPESQIRFSREVRIGELIAALVAISTLATGYIELRLRPIDQQFKTIERQMTSMEQHIARLEAAGLLTKREVREDLGRLEAKIDRLLEREQRTHGGR